MTKPVADRHTSLSILPGSYNVLREPLRPVACWSLGESVFSFGQTFVGRGTKKDFARFRELRAEHPDAVIALFGHADAEGDEDYNHDLGALRARAVYGVLVRDPEIWCEMYQANPDALVHVKQRLRSKYTIPKNEVGVGAATRDAIAQHIAELAGPLQMAPEEFLGEHGQYSMQSCSEFNPLRRSSDELQALLDIPQRIAYQRPNRRVLAFFFPPQTHVDGWWPCPRPGDGVNGCKPRFWSDAKTRRSTTRAPRQFVPTGFVGGGPVPPVVAAEDVFACRFYDRIAHRSACERAAPWIPPKPDDIFIVMDPEYIRVDPAPEPKPAPDPETLQQLVLMCSHENRYNSGYLKRATSPDRIELVPDGEDIVYASVTPRLEVLWSCKPDETPPVGALAVVSVAEVNLATNPSFFSLMNMAPDVRQVEATWNHKTLAVEVHAYPHLAYRRNFESELESLRAVLSPALKAWQIIGDVLVDGITVDVLDPTKCDLKAWGAWKESPVDEFTVDYRAFFAYDLALTGGPLFSASGELSVSASRLVEKLKKVPGFGKALEKLPEKFQNALDSVAFAGSVSGQIDGPLSIARSGPDTVVTKNASGAVEYSGSFKLGVSDFEIVKATLEFTCSLELGVSFDFAEELAVFVLSGNVGASVFKLFFRDNVIFEAEPLNGWSLDPTEFRLSLP